MTPTDHKPARLLNKLIILQVTACRPNLRQVWPKGLVTPDSLFDKTVKEVIDVDNFAAMLLDVKW